MLESYNGSLGVFLVGFVSVCVWLFVFVFVCICGAVDHIQEAWEKPCRGRVSEYFEQIISTTAE
jgi:hypothetical protein